MATKRKKSWSYNTGERNRNWVRAFEDGPGGKLYLEWRETVPDPETGQEVTVRRRRCLKGILDKTVAKAKADRLAAEFDTMEAPRTQPITLARLLNIYLKEVTPGKSVEKQMHDRRAAKMFVTFFNASPEVSRRANRKPQTLDRTDWDRFITARRNGRIPGFGPVKDRAVEHDLDFLLAVLTWATGAGENGRTYLEQHPLSASKRRAQKWERPREQNPMRPPMTDEIRARLIEHSPGWRFTLALVLGKETISRNASVRRLRWSDIDLEAKTAHWRPEFDKNGWDVVTPLSDEAVEALRAVPRGIGDAWVFPSERNPSKPVSRSTMGTWMQRARKAAGVHVPGLGFHGEKRWGVRNNRDLPPKVLETLARTDYGTLLKIYDGVDLDTLRDAVNRKQRRA